MQLAVLLQKNINCISSLDHHWKSWMYLALCFFHPVLRGHINWEFVNVSAPLCWVMHAGPAPGWKESGWTLHPPGQPTFIMTPPTFIMTPGNGRMCMQ